MFKNFIALFLFSQARLGHTRSLGARRGSAVVSMPGDHYQMDLHVLERDPTGIRILVHFYFYFNYFFAFLIFNIIGYKFFFLFPLLLPWWQRGEAFFKFLNFSSVVAFPCQQALKLNRRIDIKSDHICTSITVIRNYCRDSPFGHVYKMDFLWSQRYQMSLRQSKIQTPLSICGQVEGIIFHAIHAISLTSAALLVPEI